MIFLSLLTQFKKQVVAGASFKCEFTWNKTRENWTIRRKKIAFISVWTIGYSITRNFSPKLFECYAIEMAKNYAEWET